MKLTVYVNIVHRLKVCSATVLLLSLDINISVSNALPFLPRLG